MPGLGLPQQPAPAKLLEVVHHRALADILQFLPNGDGSFRVNVSGNSDSSTLGGSSHMSSATNERMRRYESSK